MTLEKISLLIGIVVSIGVIIGWVITSLEKKAKRREEAKLKAQAIDQKLLNLEASYGRLTEELEDVRKDFAQFVQQLLFKSK